jgi:hypothetical protein
MIRYDRALRSAASVHLYLAVVLLSCVSAVQAQSSEPISFVAHGAMFDSTGDQITPSLAFVQAAQNWYRDTLLEKLSTEDQERFVKLESGLVTDLPPQNQDRLIVNARLIDWLLDKSLPDHSYRLRGRVNALNATLRNVLQTSPRKLNARSEPYSLSDAVALKLRDSDLMQHRNDVFLITPDGGETYRKLCSDHGVPLPPDFGPGSPWTSRGVIANSDLYIVRENKAEILTYESQNPKGMCIALPRFDEKDIVQADGVICLGHTDPLDPNRAKTCFWDNQDPNAPAEKAAFTFPKGGFQSTSVFAGGADLRSGVGGVCSDCHSGENPYIIHGKELEDTSDQLASLMFAPTWYEPIVRNGDEEPWPENPGPMLDAPKVCAKCHDQGDAGRLPRINKMLNQYCLGVLRPSLGARALTFTKIGEPPILNPPAAMPPSKPGSYVCTPNVPEGDPRRVACSAIHTTNCTPPFPPKADGTPDPRSGDSFYELKCTADVAALLARCDVSEAVQTTSLKSISLGESK